MNKICTSVEQSKKLIELGIDVNSADIIYTTFYGAISKDLPIPKEVYNMLKYPINDNKCIPAWSLSALLELLDEEITDEFGNDYILTIIKESLQYYLYYHNIDGEVEDIETYFYDDMIDACYDMIIKLKKRNLI